MSSTQALLSIVRSASARNTQQLDTYFSGVGTPTSAVSLKRPAETVGLSTHIPLDLSASMVKRPYVEPQSESFGRGRFREHSSFNRHKRKMIRYSRPKYRRVVHFKNE